MGGSSRAGKLTPASGRPRAARPLSAAVGLRSHGGRRTPRERQPEPVRRSLTPPADRERRIPYRPDVDGLRAVAVVAVVAYHYFPARAQGGFTGVDVFFVISGYLISTLIWRERDAGGFSLAGFYARRVRRLFPALAVVLAVVLVVGWYTLDPPLYRELGDEAAAAAGFGANILFWRRSGYFDELAVRPLLHLWSLGVEEQFYLVFPLLLVLGARRRRATPLLLGSLLAASLAVCLVRAPAHRVEAFYLLPERFWELVAGAVVAYWGGTRLRVAGAAGVALLAVAFLRTPAASFPGWWSLPAVAGAAALLAGPETDPVRRLLAIRPLPYLGRISYPLYLWHYPLLVFVEVHHLTPLGKPVRLLLVALSVVLAALTYHLVELPLRYGRRRVPVLVAMVAIAGAGGLAVTLDSGFVSRVPGALRDLSSSSDYSAARLNTLWRDRTCILEKGQPPSAFAPDCVDGKPRGAPLVLLWGDSHAADLYPGLQALQETHRFRIAQFTYSACPPLLDFPVPEQPDCLAANDYVLRQVERLAPAEVVLSAAWEQYSSVADLERTIAALRRAGVPDIVVAGLRPHWKADLPQLVYSWYERYRTTPRRLPTTLFALYPVAERDRELRLLTRRLHVAYLDTYAALCDAGGCLAWLGPNERELVMFDVSHLTVGGSRMLVRRFASALLPRGSGS